MTCGALGILFTARNEALLLFTCSDPDDPDSEYVPVDDGFMSVDAASSASRNEQLKAQLHRMRHLPVERKQYVSSEYPRVEPIPDERWFIFAGDTVRAFLFAFCIFPLQVMVNVGPDKGKCGMVMAVNRERNLIKVFRMHRVRGILLTFVSYSLTETHLGQGYDRNARRKREYLH